MATGRVPTTANSPLTAKGDLFTYSTTQARLAVGSNGDTLVADSSSSAGLRWQAKPSVNKILNSDFSIWQRGTSLTGGTIADGTYLADRWRNTWTGAGNPTNVSLTREAFTAAELNVIGYGDARYYQKMAIVTIGACDGYRVEQRIEDVTTLAGQNVTVSFWCKADEAHTLTVSFSQNFGTGGSAGASTTVTMSQATTPTSWTRVTGTVALPSISGKTIGDGSYLHIRIEAAIDADGDEFSLWGVQVEAGSVATAFQTATGTLQGELAACQRYFERFANDGGATGSALAIGFTDTTTSGLFPLPFTEKRVLPTFTFSAASGFQVNTAAATGISSGRPSKKFVRIDTTGSGYTANTPANLRFVDSTTATIDISAEL